jgi:hypothetical protein
MQKEATQELACRQRHLAPLTIVGISEPENALGDSFGEFKFEQVVRNNQSRPASELLDQLLTEVRQWQPASMAQHDELRSSSPMWFSRGMGICCSRVHVCDCG